uniref:Ig-like domain-containing protein n=1 Tax=Sphaeramia orbicularis TaxID=375764 RepID=A0A673BP72_9TELE
NYNNSSLDARISMYQNGTLLIRDVTPSDSGKYECIATSSTGSERRVVTLTVERHESVPQILEGSQQLTELFFGNQLRLDCTARGDPKPRIIWRLPSKAVVDQWHRDVKLIDAGQYVCMARNPAGENRKVYQVDIDGNPPVINGYHQNRTVIRDVASKYSRKFIDCKAEGDPTPTVTWIMPDNIFLSAPYYGSRINVHHNGTLEIRNVRPTDTAEFICMARNDGGEAVMVVQLEVTSMVRRPIFKNPFNELMLYIMLICNNTVYVYLFVASTLLKYVRKCTQDSCLCSFTFCFKCNPMF